MHLWHARLSLLSDRILKIMNDTFHMNCPSYFSTSNCDICPLVKFWRLSFISNKYIFYSIWLDQLWYLRPITKQYMMVKDTFWPYLMIVQGSIEFICCKVRQNLLVVLWIFFNMIKIKQFPSQIKPKNWTSLIPYNKKAHFNNFLVHTV